MNSPSFTPLGAPTVAADLADAQAEILRLERVNKEFLEACKAVSDPPIAQCADCLGSGDDRESTGQACPTCCGDGKVALLTMAQLDYIKAIAAKAEGK